MYIRSSFLYQRADKMTERLPSTEGAVEQLLPLLLLLQVIGRDEKKLNGQRVSGSIPFPGDPPPQLHQMTDNGRAAAAAPRVEEAKPTFCSFNGVAAQSET